MPWGATTGRRPSGLGLHLGAISTISVRENIQFPVGGRCHKKPSYPHVCCLPDVQASHPANLTCLKQGGAWQNGIFEDSLLEPKAFGIHYQS